MSLLLKIAGFALFIIGAVINFGANFMIKAPASQDGDTPDSEIEDIVLNRRLTVKTFGMILVIIGVIILFILYR